MSADGVTPPETIHQVRVVEMLLSASCTCIAEYTEASNDASSVVLLHDRGRDLDDLRIFGLALVSAGFNVLNLDLPGHGLSSGVYDRHLRRAVQTAASSADPDSHHGIAYLADGETCGRLLEVDLCQPFALVLLRPQLSRAKPDESGVWPHVPTLSIVDADDAESDAAAQRLASGAREWNVRCFLHHGNGAHGDGRDGDVDLWNVQATSLAVRFLLEQRTYWRLDPSSAQKMSASS